MRRFALLLVFIPWLALNMAAGLALGPLTAMVEALAVWQTWWWETQQEPEEVTG